MMKYGWAERSITPDKKISLVGQFAERISEYVEKPLTVTAFVADSGEDQMILVSADLLNVGWNILQGVRSRIAETGADIDPMKIVISAIHTHTGPTLPNVSRLGDRFISTLAGYRKLLEDEFLKGKKYIEKADVSCNSEIATEEENYELVVSQIVDAILAAWKTKKEGSFINAFGRAAVGMCRRAVYSDGSAQMWGDTNRAVFKELEGGNDSGIELMYILDDTNKLTGVVANIACPAQCVQHRLFVSPDFWGEAKMLLRQHFGEDIYLLALCSAAGDQCPVDLIRWVEPESDVNDPNITRKALLKRNADPSMFDLAGMRKVGKRIAREIIDVYEEGIGKKQTDILFEHITNDYQLPLRRATLAQELEAKKHIREYLANVDGDIDYNDVAHMQVDLGTLQRMELQENVDILDTEVHVIRMGTVVIATNPFELFLNYGNQIRARSLAEQTFLIQLANGSEGYLPTEKAENGGHYSAFISSGLVGHVGGDQLVRKTLEDIRKLFEK